MAITKLPSNDAYAAFFELPPDTKLVTLLYNKLNEFCLLFYDINLYLGSLSNYLSVDNDTTWNILQTKVVLNLVFIFCKYFSELLKYGIEKTNMFKLLDDKDNNNQEICICQFIEKYNMFSNLNRYFQYDKNCIYSSKIFGNIIKIWLFLLLIIMFSISDRNSSNICFSVNFKTKLKN